MGGERRSYFKSVNILSTYQSAEGVVLMLIVVFKPDLDTGDITDSITRVLEQIKQQFELVQS
jgi:hypothetical protein